MLDKIWKIFSSVKTAVILFSFIALSSIIGTVIEQNLDPEKNIVLFKKIFGEELAPQVFKISYSLGFMDMYHSWWFLTLLFLFCSNLVICSIDRLPGIYRIASEPVKPLDPDSFGKFSIRKEIKLKGDYDNIKYSVISLMKKLGFRPETLDAAYGCQLFAQKQAYSRYGVYMTHLSVIIILVGAVIGILFGFDGYLSLPEGTESNVAYARKDSSGHPLGFTVRCDDFSIQFYGTSDKPSEYMSWLTVLKDGKEVLKKAIEVNDPLRYEGYTFYQSSYGPVPDSEGILIFRVKPKDGAVDDVGLRVGDAFEIEGAGLKGHITDFSPALAFDKDGQPYTYTEMMNNPAVYIEFTEDGQEKYSGWVAKRYPQTWLLPEGHIVELVDNWGKQYTGLQVRKDPGVWVVYFGCFMITVGLYATFFMSHKKIWALIRMEKGQITVNFTANTNKNKVAFERNIYKAIESLEKI